MKTVKDDNEADAMFVIAACNQCRIEMDDIIRKYAAIVPSRLSSLFEEYIAGHNPPESLRYSRENAVPDLQGDDAYRLAAQLMAAGCDVSNMFKDGKNQYTNDP